jgi:hypothetical protein
MSVVKQLLAEDRWSMAQLGHPLGDATLRFRSRLPAPGAVADYGHRLSITWAYAAEGSGARLSAAIGEAMGNFEDHLCEAVEHDAHAVLVAVLTFDGARQWVFYTGDVAELGRRLSAIPDLDGEPYPIEVSSEQDPTWSFLRDQVLTRIPSE